MGIKRVSKGIKEENELNVGSRSSKCKNWAADVKEREKKRMWFDGESFILLRARGRLRRDYLKARISSRLGLNV